MGQEAEPKLIVEQEGGIARLTLNRPKVLNALDEDIFAALADALQRIRSDAQARVLILTGAGRAFCSGGDIRGQKERLGWNPARRRARLDQINREIVRALAELPIPTIASVNGDAVGGGLGLALGCDIRIAADTARFGLAFLRVGLSLDMGVGFFLPRAVGFSKALELACSNEIIRADEALACGLVNRVVAGPSLDKETEELARRIVSGPPLAVRLTKALLRQAPSLPLEAALSLEAGQQSLLLASEDHREGVHAFLEKKKPRFRGQ